MPNYNLTPPTLTPKDLQRFKKKIPQGLPNDACWPWIGYRNKAGYAMFRFFAGGRVVRRDIAHRVQFFLATGKWPLVVRHSCDNPPCVNPAHLIGGTQADNIEDMVAKGRQSAPKGRDCHKARLTEDNVRFIRKNWQGNGGTMSHRQLAKMFGLHKSTILFINTKGKRRTWKHVV